MAKRKDTDGKAEMPSQDAAAAANSAAAESPIAGSETPKLALAEASGEIAAAAELPQVEAPKLAEPVIGDAAPAVPTPPLSAEPVAAIAIAAKAPERSSRFALLAASVAIAAALGAMGGALGASGILRPAAATPETTVAAQPSGEIEALRRSIAHLRTELAALRGSIESGTKNSNGQFSKVTERLDRIDRAQAEPASKIAKAVETLEHLHQQAAASRETTGSVTPARPVAGTLPPQPQASQPSVVDGWYVREVYRGLALLQGRRFGLIEVEPGDTVPGVGRVESIHKQDGRWVVVTPKGLIQAAR